jgi:hypothetical protein
LLHIDIADTPINETLVTDFASARFLAQHRNVVLVGGTTPGKSHLAIGIGPSCMNLFRVRRARKCPPIRVKLSARGTYGNLIFLELNCPGTGHTHEQSG